MPTLYVEGENAFVRLQEEIMKDSRDETLFAWKNEDAIPSRRYGILAPSPAAFKDSGRFTECVDWEPRDPCSETTGGLLVTLPLQFVKHNIYVASLNCSSPHGSTGFAAIYLKKLDDHEDINHARHQNQYARIQSDKTLSVNNAADRDSHIKIYARQSVGQQQPIPVYPEHIVHLYNGPNPSLQYRLNTTMGHKSNMALQLTTWSWIPRDTKTTFRVPKKRSSLAGVIVFKRKDESYFTILFGAKSDFGDVRAWVIYDTDENSTFDEWKRKFSHDTWQSSGQLVDLGPDLVRVDIVERIMVPRKYFVVIIHAEELVPRFKLAFDLLRPRSQREPANPLTVIASNDCLTSKSEEPENAVQVRSGIKSLLRRKNGAHG